MMKKSFLTITMVFLGLFAGFNTAWAEMTPAEAETDGYWARLTAKPSTVTNGSGKVFVTEEYTDPAESDYQAVSSSADGYQEVFVMASFSLDVNLYAYAKANAGSYFTGWSYTDGNTDLGNEFRTNIGVTPSSKRGKANIREYTIYAAFEPIRIVSYEIESGSNTTADDGLGNWTCTQTIRFRAETPGVWALSSVDDVRHFKLPVITPKAGTTGTWSTSIAAWNTSNISFYGDYAEIRVPVTFTAPNGNSGEYGAELVLETYAGIKMKAYLSARTTGGEEEAIRYNKSKVQQETGNLATLLSNAAADDIIKLNNDYSGSVSIDKNITFDLNGYTLSNILTIGGGTVTLAYSPYGGSANALNVTGGKAILNGGTFGSLTIADGATVEQNGATITGTATNNGILITMDGIFQSGLTSTKTLTVNGGTFNGAIAINVTGGSATVKKGTISGTTYGVQTNGGSATIEKLAAITGGTKALNGISGSLTVNNGKFADPANLIAGDVTFNAGYFRTATGPTALGKQVWRNTAGAESREGYAFFVGSQESAQASNVSVCRIGQTAYASLEDALAYANNNPGKQMLIFMENDYLLKAGYYTIPANATLIVPMADDQQVAYPEVEHESLGKSASFPAAVSFRKLTFADGVNMNVLGTIELSCAQYCKTGSAEQAIPGGNYGHLILKPGSHITLGDGAELRAWGYVTGDGTRAGDGTYLSGEIDARRGSIVREQFQMGDWKGGDVSFTMILDEAPQNLTYLFPVYEYFIQNVESPVKYHPGASLFCATAVDVSSINAYANEIKVVGVEGEPAMFLMNQMADAENTWVRKWYDANKDQQVYEVNSGAQLGSMVINLGEVPAALVKPGTPGVFKIQLDSRKFVLPLTSNMKIHLLSGNMEFTQSTSCLPGMEVEVDKESTISIVMNEHPDEVVSGSLYFYDSDQWGKYVHSGKYGTIVHYSATLNAKPAVRSVSSAAALGDAVLNVHGTFQVDNGCAVYTTAGKTMDMSAYPTAIAYTPDLSSGGASIISTNEDAGTFVFKGNAPAANGLTIADMGGGVYMPVPNGEGKLNPDVLVNYDNSSNGIEINTALGSTAHVYGFELCTSARLKNTDGSFADTYTDAEHHAEEGDAYCFINDRWTIMEVDEDDECFMKDNYGTFYAKPADYVALANGKTPNADHTFSSADGTRLFILIKQDCQWWEVEKKDNLYHCIHPNNDTYYYWDDSNANPAKHKWVEKRFVITWKNWNGDIIQTTDENGDLVDEYSVTYGTMAEFLGSNPTREANIDYTYDFTGWTPELGPVKSDVTYTATYVEQPRKYTIIFLNEGGTEIERQFLTHNEMPSCENIPTRTGFTLQWDPEIAAVTGDATYTATWLEEPPTEYAITFFDYNGTTILQQGNVNVGVVPTPPANPANKPATSEFTYVFDHWSPAIEEVSLTSAKSYTAVYSEEAKTYEIKFYKENGTTLISTQNLPYGATPTPPTVSKENPAANTTYTLVWKTLDEASGIQTVMGPASYKPTYIAEENRYTRYTVTLSANIPAGVTLIGAGTYDEGESVTIQAVPADGYEFVEWQETHNTNPDLGAQTISADITLTAVVQATVVASDLTIGVTGVETLTEPTTKHDLIITSDGANSGELRGADYLTLTGDAYFVLDPEMDMDARTWYAVAVPWQVDATTGIYIGGVRQRLGVDIDVLYYDGANRAANGKGNNWLYLEYADDKTMQPGTFYMIYLAKSASAIRFQKKAGTALLTTTLSVEAHPQTTGNDEDAGWNGIANPALFHAYIDASSNTYSHTNFGQKYVPEQKRYDALNMAAAPMIVGDPIFVQVSSNKNITVATSNPFHAPARRAAVDNSYYEVQISASEDYTDRIYLQTMEGKEDRYVIELDLAKAGISTQVAQMWVDRYNTQLCVNTTAPVGKTATYPLGISIPATGTYQISSATTMQENQELYVTRNGKAIWNLAYGPYTVTLDKGTYSEYGIKLIQSNAPATTTGVGQTSITNDQLRKVLIDNKVYIIREGAIYTITGQKVE